MDSKTLTIDELKKVIIKNIKKLDRHGYAKKCLVLLEKYMPNFKDTGDAEKAKAEGNRLYSQKSLTFSQLNKILILFNKSIAFAPNDSEELAGAYANKSAVLLRMRMYNECITEIDKALKITKLLALIIKLLCRKAACLTALGSGDNRRCLEKAKYILTKLEDKEEIAQGLKKLIDSTQSTVDKDKLDIPKEDKRITQALEMIEKAERRDLSESIRLEFSKIHGKHLVAARDYKPGEIIITEKPYLNSLDDSRAYHYCDHCFNHLWTAVPCNNCPRRLYCSEECKTQAWNDHHEMECFTLACMEIAFASKWFTYIPFVMSFFCKAFKEAISIEQLVADSEASCQFDDQSSNNSSSNPNFKSYTDIFSLPFDMGQSKMKVCTEVSIIVLMGLAKYTKVLGKTYHFVEMKKLVKDDTAILVGALLLKFSILLGNGHNQIFFVDPIDQNEDLSESDEHREERSNERHREYSYSLPLLRAHTVNSCIPNVLSHPSHGSKIILCAITPIKAGEQLIKGHSRFGSWESTPKLERQLDHCSIYGCPCGCRACSENWPAIAEDPDQIVNLFMDETHCPLTSKLWEEHNSIVSDWTANCHKPSYPDIKMLHRTVDVVTAAWKQLLMPSPIITKSVLLLRNILTAFYDRSEMYAKAPHIRPKKIGTILDHSSFCSCESE